MWRGRDKGGVIIPPSKKEVEKIRARLDLWESRVIENRPAKITDLLHPRTGKLAVDRTIHITAPYDTATGAPFVQRPGHRFNKIEIMKAHDIEIEEIVEESVGAAETEIEIQPVGNSIIELEHLEVLHTDAAARNVTLRLENAAGEVVHLFPSIGIPVVNDINYPIYPMAYYLIGAAPYYLPVGTPPLPLSNDCWLVVSCIGLLVNEDLEVRYAFREVAGAI